MATTSDEGDQIFRRRLSRLESEPDENALSRILAQVNPPTSRGPAGWKRLLRRSVATLIFLTGLTIGPDFLPPERIQPSRLAPPALPPAGPFSPIPSRTGTTKTPNLTGRPQFLATASGQPRKTSRPISSTYVLSFKSTVVNQQLGLHSGLTKQPPNHAEAALVAVSLGSDFSATKPDKDTDVSPVIPEFNRLFLSLQQLLVRKPTLNRPALPPMGYRPTTIDPPQRSAPPAFYVKIMPLYTFRKVTPSRQDNMVMEQIRPATALSTRMGWHLQIGTEWTLTSRFRLRTGLVYQQLQQELTYNLRSVQPDSASITVIDGSTARITPIYTVRRQQSQTNWQYAGLSAEGCLKLARGLLGQHYLTAGGSVGYTLNHATAQRWQPFLQASYGFERPLNAHLWLQIEPGIIYNVNPLTDRSQHFSVHPYSYGLAMALRWQ